MSIVAGVDFGTLNVRVSIFHNERGRLGFGTADYPLHRKAEDPDHATQSHADHLRALETAMRAALAAAGVQGREVEALALDTTGSSVIPVDSAMQPLSEYYLWCDHRAWREAAEITRVAHEQKLEAIAWCGGVYSVEWGFSKLLHWLRHNPGKRAKFASAFEHCDFIAATLCGVTSPDEAVRSVCAMGHKWMWNPRWDGLPSQEFLTSVDPLLATIRPSLQGRYATSDQLAGHLSSFWAAKLGLRPGTPIPVGAFDAHWDAVGAGLRLGDAVNVIGTSTCIVGMSEGVQLVPGVCGVVPGSVYPQYTGIEAGLSATGDIFDAIARRAGTDVRTLSQGLERYHAGETGLLRLTWDNGDRTVLVNPELGGVTLGWNLSHTAQDELFAAIEGTAFHTRVILERMEEHGAPILRVINGGGIPQRNAVLNQVYANVLEKPVLVPSGDVTSLGSAIFAFLAAGAFTSIEEAQTALCPPHEQIEPEQAAVPVYRELYQHYRELYFALGTPGTKMGAVLPRCGGEESKAMVNTLRETVLEANLELVRRGLVLYTFGNASGIDRERGLVVIKPSGVPYEAMRATDLVVTDLEGRIVEGSLKPSSDLATHIELYRAFPKIGAVVHTHSRMATAWAQAGLEIPCLGTTHADYFHGPVPLTEALSSPEIEEGYERATGLAIVRRFEGLDPLALPGVLVQGHATFCWGRDPADAAHHAVILEEIAALAYYTTTLNPAGQHLPRAVLDKHHLRKHGPEAYYGQPGRKH